MPCSARSTAAGRLCSSTSQQFDADAVISSSPASAWTEADTSCASPPACHGHNELHQPPVTLQSPAPRLQHPQRPEAVVVVPGGGEAGLRIARTFPGVPADAEVGTWGERASLSQASGKSAARNAVMGGKGAANAEAWVDATSCKLTKDDESQRPEINSIFIAAGSRLHLSLAYVQ